MKILMQRHRVVLAGGYTAGHIYPLIAVGQEFGAREREIVVMGNADGPEAAIVPAAGFTFRPVTSAPLRGSRDGHQRARAFASTAAGVWAARKLLSEAPVALVAGFGGYVSAAPIVAARTLGIPTAIFEANAIPGLANRYLRSIADIRFAGLAATTDVPGWSDAVVSGHPIREDVLRSTRERVRENGAPLQLLITGGLRGSAFLNAAGPALAAELQRRGIALTVRHQTGGQPAEVERAYARAGIRAEVEAFIADIASAFDRCDAVICAGGAGTLSELDALSIPVLIVPIAGTADDHQTANARAFTSRESVAWMSAETFAHTAAADMLLRVIATSAGARVRAANAAAVVVDHCERLIARRRPVLRRYDPIERASY